MTRYTEALAADREALIGICTRLDQDSWEAPSGCPGWSVKDLVSHMGALYWAVVDPSVLQNTPDMGTEDGQELVVRSRRSMTSDQTLDDYATVSEKAIATLLSFDGVDEEIPLGDLGTYPLSVLPTAFCFDHFTHIRTDLFSPRGPFNGPAPASDELRLGPTLEWIEAAIPQQNRTILESDRFGAADLVVSGTPARTIRIGNPTGPASATAYSDADALVRWITQRGDWPSLGVETEGDAAALGISSSSRCSDVPSESTSIKPPERRSRIGSPLVGGPRSETRG